MTETTYRVDRRTLAGDWPILLLLALDVAFALWALPRMPERVPVHWNLWGEVDGYGPGWINALLPAAISVAMYAGMLLAPLIDPKRANYALFPDTMRVVRWTLTGLFVAMHFVLVLSGLGYPVDVPFVIRLALPVMVMVLGNSLGRVRHNYFVGFKLPWTLASEEIWVRTHRLAARWWVAGGLVQLAAAFLPSAWGFAVFMTVFAVITVGPSLYAYQLFKYGVR